MSENLRFVIWCFLGLWVLAIIAVLVNYLKLKRDEWKAYKEGGFDGRALR